MSPFESYSRGRSGAGYLWPVFLFLLIAAGVLAWWLWPPGSSRDLAQAARPRPITPAGELDEEQKSTIATYKNARRSVVHVTSLSGRGDQLNLNYRHVPRGTGSGIIWDEFGHIVTNYHVIQDASAARVTLADRSTWDAELVGAHPDKDLAVLRIKASKDKLYPIPIGTSHDLQVGQRVLAIGNPFGLDQTLTTGIISALGREIEAVTGRRIKDVIQTDAAINPGNSGGPLLDSFGRLIGVNTAIYSPSGASVGIGFAIPVDEVNRIVPQLIQDRKVTRPVLGVQIAPDQWAKELGLTGVLVMEVVAESPAAKAGLRPTRRTAEGQIVLGDVLVAINEHPVKSLNDLFDALERFRPGDSVRIKWLRDGQEQGATVILAAP